MNAPSRNHPHHLVQATVRPVDEDGVAVAVTGTVVFVLASLWLWWRLPQLRAAGHGWYLQVALAGVVLGMVGVAWCLRRKRQH